MVMETLVDFRKEHIIASDACLRISMWSFILILFWDVLLPYLHSL